MPSLIRIADVAQVPAGTGTVCSVDGSAFALFHVAGHFYATENACPHRSGQLGQGQFDGSIVTCPLHGWQFNVATGECVGRPGGKIRCFPTRLDGDSVFVELPTPAQKPGTNSCAAQILVRFGAMGHVGRFEAAADLGCSRGSRVVLQTSRGVEVGEMLLAAGKDAQLVQDQAVAPKVSMAVGAVRTKAAAADRAKSIRVATTKLLPEFPSYFPS